MQLQRIEEITSASRPAAWTATAPGGVAGTVAATGVPSNEMVGGGAGGPCSVCQYLTRTFEQRTRHHVWTGFQQKPAWAVGIGHDTCACEGTERVPNRGCGDSHLHKLQQAGEGVRICGQGGHHRAAARLRGCRRQQRRRHDCSIRQGPVVSNYACCERGCSRAEHTRLSGTGASLRLASAGRLGFVCSGSSTSGQH